MIDSNIGKLVRTKQTLHAYGRGGNLTNHRVPLRGGTFMVVPNNSIGIIIETVSRENRAIGYKVCIFSLGITNFVDIDAVVFIT